MNRQQEDDYIDIGVFVIDFLKGMRKFWYWILVFVIAGIAVYSGYRRASYVPMYKATASFTVKTAGVGTLNEVSTAYNFYYDKNTAGQIGKTFPYILSSNLLQGRLQEELGTENVNGYTTAQVIEDSNLVTLTTVSSDPQDALDILKAVIEVYPEISQYVIGETRLEMIEEPETDEDPYNSPDQKKNIAVGAGMGFLAAMALISVYALMRKTIRSETDLKKVLSAPCLALLPELRANQSRMKLSDTKINAGFLESMYSLQNRIDYLMQKNGQKVLLVTSTGPSEGKSTVSLNLAIAMAQRGKKVLLLDGDLRKPDIRKRLGIKQETPSIQRVVSGAVSPENAVYYLEDEGVYFLGNSKPTKNPIRLVDSREMENLIKKLRNFADIVIIDTPPCGMMADAGHYYEYADAVLLIIRQDWTDGNRVMDAVSDLPEGGCKLIGCVLNMVKTGLAGYGYGYGHYGYGRYNHYKGRDYGSYRSSGRDERD